MASLQLMILIYFNNNNIHCSNFSVIFCSYPLSLIYFFNHHFPSNKYYSLKWLATMDICILLKVSTLNVNYTAQGTVIFFTFQYHSLNFIVNYNHNYTLYQYFFISMKIAMKKKCEGRKKGDVLKNCYFIVLISIIPLSLSVTRISNPSTISLLLFLFFIKPSFMT